MKLSYSKVRALTELLRERNARGANVVRLWGGLGNQMFQYAFGQLLKHNTGLETFYDASWFERRCADRAYGLAHFNISPRFVPGRCVRLLSEQKRWLRWFGYCPLFTRIHQDSGNVSGEDYEHSVNAFLIGYFQSARYYESIRPKLMQDFQVADIPPEAVALAEQIAADNRAVSLHVRRGDYVNNSMFPLCTMEYYTAAVQYVTDRIGTPTLYCFSDDIPWVRENLRMRCTLIPVDLSCRSRPELDIYLMSCCRHNIIANSSFSRWGAWLNNHMDKIVVAPRQWSYTGTANNLPGAWITL